MIYQKEYIEENDHEKRFQKENKVYLGIQFNQIEKKKSEIIYRLYLQ